jgi:O-antigen/teichoic acid export membrane protein
LNYEKNIWGQAGHSFMKSNEFLKNVITLTGGTVIGQAIIVLASPIITRLYNPSDFGVLAVYSSILGILTVVSSCRYETVIPLPEKDEDAANLIGLSLIVILAMSLLVAGILIAFGNHILELIKVPRLKYYLWFLVLGTALIGNYQVFTMWAVRKQVYGLIARTKIYQGFGSVLTQVCLGMFSIKPLGLLIGQVVGLASGGSTAVVFFTTRSRGLIRSINPGSILRVAQRYKKFPLVGAPAAVLNSITLNIPAILLAAIYGMQVAGWYSITQRALGIPFNLVGLSIAQAYMGKAAPMARTYPQKLGIFTYWLFFRLLIIGILAITPVVVLAPKIFVLVFGAKWEESGLYLSRLAPLYIGQLASSPLGCTLDILERQGLLLTREIIRIGLIIISFLFISILGLSSRAGITVLGIAGAIGYTIYIYITFYAIHQSHKSQ